MINFFNNKWESTNLIIIATNVGVRVVEGGEFFFEKSCGHNCLLRWSLGVNVSVKKLLMVGCSGFRRVAAVILRCRYYRQAHIDIAVSHTTLLTKKELGQSGYVYISHFLIALLN
jgi:hypothetical protein